MPSDAALAQTAHDQFVTAFDRRPLKIGVITGVAWAISPGAIGLNGYALVPAEGHPWSRGFPDDLDEQIEIHGGITWCCYPWLGFDTNHARDYWPPEYDPKGIMQQRRAMMLGSSEGLKKWTLDLAIYEARWLAAQVSLIGLEYRQQLASKKNTGLSRFANLDVAERNTHHEENT